jgi:hypothetical protein
MFRLRSAYSYRENPPTIGGFQKDGLLRTEPQKYVKSFSCIFYHIPSYSKLFTLLKEVFKEIFVITPITIFLQQRMNLQLHSLRRNCVILSTSFYCTRLICAPILAWAEQTETAVRYLRIINNVTITVLQDGQLVCKN